MCNRAAAGTIPAAAFLALGDVPFVPALWDTPCHWCKVTCPHCAKRRVPLSGRGVSGTFFWAYNCYWLAAVKARPLRSYFYS